MQKAVQLSHDLFIGIEINDDNFECRTKDKGAVLIFDRVRIP